MASDGDGSTSDDWHTAAGESASKRSVAMESDDAAPFSSKPPASMPPRPPPSPRPPSRLSAAPFPKGGVDDNSSLDSHSTAGQVYIRASDGKRVRRVKKRRSNTSIQSSDDDASSMSSVGSSISGVYIRASDGKRVRRVRRSHKRTTPKSGEDIPTQVSVTSPRRKSILSETTTGEDNTSSSAPLQHETSNKMEDGNVTASQTSVSGKEEGVKEDALQQSAKKDLIMSAEAPTTAPTEINATPKESTTMETKELANQNTTLSSKPSQGSDAVPMANKSKKSLPQETHAEQKVADTTTKVMLHECPTTKQTNLANENVSFSRRSTVQDLETDNALRSATHKALDALSTSSKVPMLEEKAVNPWLVEPTEFLEDGISPSVEESTSVTKEEPKFDTLFQEFVVLQQHVVAAETQIPSSTPDTRPSLQATILDVPNQGNVIPDTPVLLSAPPDQQVVDSSTSEHFEAPDRYQHDQNHLDDTQHAAVLDYATAIETMGVTAVASVRTANATRAVTGPPPPVTTVEFLSLETTQEKTNHPPQTTTLPVPQSQVSNEESLGGSSSLDAYPSEDAISPKAALSEYDEELQGGRLWREASRMSSSPPPAKRRQLPEPLMARTRSRADVDAFVTPPRTPISSANPSSAHLVRLNDDDNAFILHTAFAKKRVKVVQLLIFGLIGLAFGFLGSFYVQSSCHFLTATVEVGGQAEEFELHYGMWKYTPLSSAFDGYSYCYKYDGQYTTDTPILPRIFGLVALLLGIYTLAVVWVYLVIGRTDLAHWKRAIYASAVSGVFQALTMVFFAGSMCHRNRCSVGPGAAVSIVSTLTWFVLAFEMHYNSPIHSSLLGQVVDDEIASPDGIVASLKISDVGDGMTAFFRRVTSATNGEGIPTLNQFRRDKRKSPARRSVYVPPDFEYA